MCTYYIIWEDLDELSLGWESFMENPTSLTNLRYFNDL